MSTGKIAKRYNPVRKLGEGSMGVVWLVEDLVEGRQVALKAIGQTRLGERLPALVSHSDAPADLARSALAFKQEFRLMTRLRHPNCCAVYDYGVLEDGAPFFTMEVVPGRGLDEILPLEAPALEAVVIQLLRALGHVHDLGLVHGDLKPSNVRRMPDGAVKLMDFGLMEHAGRTGAPIRGTLAYLAPEVVRRGTVDQRADLYALGCLAYELWTGRPPFVGERPIDVLRAQVEERPQPTARYRPGLDAKLEALIEKLLAKDPLERPQSAYEALAELGLAAAESSEARLLTSAMVGREAELAQLGRYGKDVRRGAKGALIALWGPPGVGKSRLVEEFRFEAQLANLPVASSPNHEFAQSPYGPIVRVLRGLMPAFKVHVRADLDRLAPILAKVLPELGVTPAPELDPPTTEKMRLQAGMAEILIALARAAGLVLVMEDWQWADALSDQFLEYLARNLGDAPAMLIVTSHRDPLGQGGWREGSIPLALSGLSTEAVGRVLASMLGRAEVEPFHVQRMARLSEGNPYMIEMILEHAVQVGALVRERGQWRWIEPKDAEALPSDLRALQALKLERLDATARLVARTASAFGYLFELPLLKRVTGLDEETLFAAVDALSAHHVFVETEAGAYRFARDQLQDVLYNDIEESERVGLHTAIARALEQAAQASSDADIPLDGLTMIADQFMRGNMPEKTIAYCLLAGVRHARLFATTDAARYLEAGLAQVVTLNEGRWRRAKLDFLATLGDVRRLLGEFEASRAHYEAAMPLAELLEDDFRLCRMAISLARVHQAMQRFPEALVAAKRGTELAIRIDDLGEAARGLMTMGRVKYFSGDVAGAIADHERARELAVAGRDPARAHLAAAFLGYLRVSSEPGRADEGMALMNAAIGYLEEVGDKIGLNNTLDFLGNTQMAAGDFGSARATFLRKLAICKEVGLPDEASVARVNLALAALRLGRYAEAADEARAAAEVSTELASYMPLACAVAYGAEADVALGRIAEGLAASREAVGIARGRKNRYLESLVGPSHLDVLLALGLLADAEAEAEALATLIAETGHAESAPAVDAARAELAARAGRGPEALALALRAVEGARTARARGQLARALCGQARVALEAGLWDEAGRQLTEGRGLAETLGLAGLLAELDLLAGELALAIGKPEVAAAHFEAALATAERLAVPLTAALASFGLASARPYDPAASGRAQAAGEALAALVAGLDEPARAAFLGAEERKRVIEGNYHGHSLPRRTAPLGKTAPLPAMAEELWKRL